MTSPSDSSTRALEKGQLFAGWVVGMFVIAALVIYVADTMRRARNGTQSVIYRELALNVAKAGFEDGQSFFRTHNTATSLNASEAPTSQNWVTPWPAYPDAAFQPGSGDTDFASNISLTTSLGTTCTGGIIGDIPMNQYVTYTGSDEMTGSQLWGRYVIRRQNIANWSPGPDTATANTDPDACHDISAISAQSTLGSGTRWSIVSHGYLLRLPSPLTTTSFTSSLLGTKAAFTSGNLLSAPLAYYNNQPFLLAQARVYGEVARVYFNLPSSALWCSSVSINQSGYVNSGGVSGQYCVTSGLTGVSNTGDCNSCTTGTYLNTITRTPTVGSCFVGQTWTSLQEIAVSLEGGANITGYVGGSSELPIFNSYNSVTGLSFSTQVNQPAFYFLNQNINLTAGESESSQVPVLSGVGLCVVQGSLTIAAGNPSTWAGVLYVKGQVTLHGPFTIAGILISETGITIGADSDNNKATADYDTDLLSMVQGLQSFTVLSSSIMANQF